MCNLHTHTPATFFIIRSRRVWSANKLSSQTSAGESESSSLHSLLEPRHCSLFVCVVQRVFWDHKWCTIHKPVPAIFLLHHPSGLTKTSFKATLLPAFRPLLTCKGRLKEVQSSVLCVIARDVSPSQLHLRVHTFFFPWWSFHSTQPQDTTQKTLPLLYPPFLTHCVHSMCFIPPPTLCHCFVYLHSTSVKQMHLPYLATGCLP